MCLLIALSCSLRHDFFVLPIQGILSVPGIAGYKWVPARIGGFGSKKILFLAYQRLI